MTGVKKKVFKLTSNSEYKALDYAITKATSNKRKLPKEKHVRTIFYVLAPSSPRTDVIYCLSSLASRLSQTRHWVVAWKTLIIIHRAMRELDNTVWEEFINYSRQREHMLNLLHFKDTSSPDATEYSTWIQNYAFYLDERLRCYYMLNYDAVTYTAKETKLDAQDLLQQLPHIQDLQAKLLQCKPRAAALYNPLIQYSLSIIANESVKLYVSTTIRVVALLDKFFEMSRPDATKALEIYKKSGNQGRNLAAFFEICRGMEFGRGQKFINIREPPAAFMATLEEYLEDPTPNMELEDQVSTDKQGDKQGATAKANTASEGDHVLVDNKPDAHVADLLGLDDLLTGASEFEQNSKPLAVVPSVKEDSSRAGNGENNVSCQASGWEDALFADSECKSDQELNRSEEDSVEDGTREERKNPFESSQNSFTFYPYPPAATMMPQTTSQGELYPYPPFQGHQDMSYQQTYMMQQQQQQQQSPIETNHKSTNPFE